ncbi:MAG: hypothetical protein PVG78_01265 [Desulfobacterales bacterium]|jgi:hypothetical protein
MKMKPVAIALVLAVLLAPVLGRAAEVAQGQCLNYSKEAGTLKIEEYDTNISKDTPYGNPTGIISQFDLTRAKVGITPETGDVVRVAYEIKEDQKVALKVMNVSKQDLRKK